jgi:hypothetical protein
VDLDDRTRPQQWLRPSHPTAPTEGKARVTNLTNTAVRHAIVELVSSDPARGWRGIEIAENLGDHRIVDVMVALAVLCGDGELQRTGIGIYKANNSAGPALPVADTATDTRLAS